MLRVNKDVAVLVLKEWGCQPWPAKKCEGEFLQCQRGLCMQSQLHSRVVEPEIRKGVGRLVEENPVQSQSIKGD